MATRLRIKSKHFLTGTELSRQETLDLLLLAESCREQRLAGFRRDDLRGKNVALLFEKPSLRTRVSFTVAIQELGGFVLELDSIGRKKEDPEDTIRVLAGYCHAVMVRTHAHSILDRMVAKSPIPVINGLSDTHHPCQVLADLQTLMQRYRELKGLKLAYIGDGNNMLHSLLLLAPALGVEVHYATPKGYEPSSLVVRQAKKRAKDGGGAVVAHEDPVEAVRSANAVYTDVWTSMGFEQEETNRDQAFQSFQLNETLYSYADPKAAIMHCMPMIKDKEITASLVEHENSVLFQQAENRMHAQKALLIGLAGNV
ncbi:MAG: ornithine carbamoyltransferase [Bdellovibrionaceae bacterium]|nr:ornithine carbamoyltransferase [Pseudobdellovibrionaceae bacterium]